MSFFKDSFSKLFFSNETQNKIRQLDHPSQLRQGDIIVLDDHFALPPQLRGQQLEITAVNQYQWQTASSHGGNTNGSKEKEWQLQGDGQQGNASIYLSLEEDDQTWLCFSLKLTRAQVSDLFDLDQFADIFEPESFTRLRVNEDAAQKQPELAPWLAAHYQQQTQVAFADFFASNNGQGEPLNHYELIDDQEKFALFVEVYGNSDTDVLLGLYRPLSDIREYWPGETDAQ